MERDRFWEIEQVMDSKTAVKFQMDDGRWCDLIPDDRGFYQLIVEESSRIINPDNRLTPDQMADRTMQRRADRISHHKGIPDMGLPPVEVPVDPQKTLADIRRLKEIPDVKIRRRPKHGRA